MSPAPILRSTRATVFATVCMTLATAGHAVAAHATVAPWAIGLGFAAVFVVAWVLAGVERSLATILGGLLGGQFALHSLFSSAAAMGGDGAGMGHPMHHSAMPGHGGMAMTFAHILAAVVSAWWLHRGERAVWALARRAAALAAGPLRALLALLDCADPTAVAVPLPARTTAVRMTPPRSPLRHCVIRRGPPFHPTIITCG